MGPVRHHFMSLFIAGSALLPQLFSIDALSQEQSQPTMDVYSSTTVQRNRRREHPSKFLKCWGRDTEWDPHTEVVQKQFKSRSGNNVQVVATGGHGDIADFAAESLNWNSEFDVNSLFKVNFSQSFQKSKTNEWSTECNTTKTTSDLLASHNEFSAGLSLIVPTGVYVLRVKNVSSAGAPEIKASVSHDTSFAAAMKMRGAFVRELKTTPGPLRTGDYEYYFVRPGDRLNFHITYRSETIQNVSYSLGYEIAFMGSFRCDKTVGDPLSVNIGQDGILKQFSSISDEQGLHRFIEYTSCLRRPDYVKEIMLNNHGKEIAQFIKSLTDILQTNSVLSSTRFQAYAQLIGSATLVDLAQVLVKDMYTFCSPKEISVLIGDLPEKFKANVRSYHAAAREYVKIAYLLERATNPAVQIYLKEVGELQDQGTTYKEAVNDPETLEYLRRYQYELGRDFRVFQTISNIVKDLPQLVAGSNQKKGLNDIVQSLNTQSLTLANDLKASLLNFVQRKDSSVDLGNLPTKWNTYSTQVKSLADMFKNDLDWFHITDGVSHSKFTADLHYLSSTVLSMLTEKLKSDAYFKEVISRSGTIDDPNGIDFDALDKLNKQVMQCLETPTNQEVVP